MNIYIYISHFVSRSCGGPVRFTIAIIDNNNLKHFLDNKKKLFYTAEQSGLRPLAHSALDNFD